MLHKMRHLAVLAACYMGAQVIAAAVLMGVQVPMRAVLVATLTRLGTYLLDRAGPWPGPVDRGDLQSAPDRVRLMRRYGAAVRTLAVTALLAAQVMALPLGVYATLAPLSVVGLVGYAHWAVPGRRVKDRLWIKTLAVAGCITAFAVLLVQARGEVDAAVLWPVGLVLLLRVSADAMRCDLDDAYADARQGTRTLANVYGAGFTWRVSVVLDLAAAGVAIAAIGHMRWTAVLWMALLPAAAGITLAILRPRQVRDLVDGVGAAAVVVAWLVSR